LYGCLIFFCGFVIKIRYETVAFLPTLTVNPQTFRTTRAGALAYFVGGDSAFPKDTGFALKDWTKCEVTNAAVLLLGNYANSMGKVN
jgi:hypothetical protein